MSRIVRMGGGALAKRLGDLDPSAGVNSGLVWCLGSHPAGAPLLGTELVSRNSGTLNGTAAFSADHPTESWKSLDLPAFDDNWTVAIDSAFETALDGADEYSVAMHLEIVDGEDFGVLFSLPWFDSSWATPYSTIRMLRQGSSTERLTHAWSSGAFHSAGTSTGDMWVTDGNDHWIGLARNGGSFDWYFDGSLVQATSDDADALAFNASGSSKMVLGTRNDSSLAESVKARFHSMSIWDRELSAGEFSSLNSSPTQQFIT